MKTILKLSILWTALILGKAVRADCADAEAPGLSNVKITSFYVNSNGNFNITVSNGTQTTNYWVGSYDPAPNFLFHYFLTAYQTGASFNVDKKCSWAGVTGATVIRSISTN